MWGLLERLEGLGLSFINKLGAQKHIICLLLMTCTESKKFKSRRLCTYVVDRCTRAHDTSLHYLRKYFEEAEGVVRMEHDQWEVLSHQNTARFRVILSLSGRKELLCAGYTLRY